MVLAGAIAAWDFALPLGIAGGLPYIALVFLALLHDKPRMMYVLAGVGTALTLVKLPAFFPDIPPMAAVNRLLTVAAIWGVAIGLTLFRERLARSETVRLVERERQEAGRALLRERELQLAHLRAQLALLSGIAHYVNNMINGAMAQADLIAEALPDASADRDAVDRLLQLHLRAADIINRVLATMDDPVEGGPVCAGAEAAAAVRQFDPSAAECVLEVSGPCPVRASAGSVTRLVAALVRNAVQNGGRRIRVTVGCREITAPAPDPLDGDPRPHRSMGRLGPGDWVRIAVEDDGHGMTAPVLEQCPVPFFTTSEVRLGLGLTEVSNGAVGRLGGVLAFGSAVGQGSLFVVWLPSAATACSRPQTDADASPTTAGA